MTNRFLDYDGIWWPFNDIIAAFPNQVPNKHCKQKAVQVPDKKCTQVVRDRKACCKKQSMAKEEATWRKG